MRTKDAVGEAARDRRVPGTDVNERLHDRARRKGRARPDAIEAPPTRVEG